MYWRKGRLSFWIGRWRFWVRLRTEDDKPNGFFFHIGKETG